MHAFYGFAILPIALEAVDDWPFPRAGEKYSLSIMDTTFEAIIPDSPSLRFLLQRRRTLSVSSPKHQTGNIHGDLLGSPTLTATSFPFVQELPLVMDEQAPKLNSRRVSGLFEDMSLLPLMKYTHEIIDLLWAQLVLSHSILVYGSSVSIVTQCVLSLASLICPLEPQLDIRPTLTIYDSDLSAFSHPSSPLFLLAGTTDPQVVKMLSPHVDLLVLGEGETEISEYPGAAGISHLLAETDFLRTRLIQHSVSIREGWNDRFLNDIRMVLRMQYKLDDASGLSAFLHNLFYRHTVTFLSPFRHCLKVFREEVFASPHHPYSPASLLLRNTDEWRVEEFVHSHPELLKYPFSEGANELLYRFSVSPQVACLLRALRREVDAELIVKLRSIQDSLNKEEFCRLLPNDAERRDVIKQRIKRELEREVTKEDVLTNPQRRRRLESLRKHYEWICA
ncbi:hypothetical protein WA538_001557, partial [Blastocystis sp. DL]